MDNSVGRLKYVVCYFTYSTPELNKCMRKIRKHFVSGDGEEFHRQMNWN